MAKKSKKMTMAGPGSAVDPTKPSYGDSNEPRVMPNSSMQGRMGEVNPFGGQTTGSRFPGLDREGLDKLVDLNDAQSNPYVVTGDSFSPVDADPALKGGAMWPSSKGAGHNELVDPTMIQCSPRTAEDDGMGAMGSGTPVPSRRGMKVDATFKPELSDEGGMSLPGFTELDFQTGKLVAPGSRTPVDEVPGRHVHIGKHSK